MESEGGGFSILHGPLSTLQSGVVVTGLAAVPDGTLIDRALERLADGALSSAVITRDILGIPRAPDAVSERLASALLDPDPRVRRRWDGIWELAPAARAAPALDDVTFAVVDVETTGSRPARGDRITEIAVVLVGPDGVETVLDRLVNPERPIPPAVTAVTRITDAMVRDAPVFAEIADEVLRALAGRVFVAHNARFDWGFLRHELHRARTVRLDGPRLCTVDLSRRLLTGLPSRSLDSVAWHFGVTIEPRHRAGGDARATASILRRLLDAAREAGAETLEDLRRVDRRVKKPRRGRRRPGPEWMDDA